MRCTLLVAAMPGPPVDRGAGPRRLTPQPRVVSLPASLGVLLLSWFPWRRPLAALGAFVHALRRLVALAGAMGATLVAVVRAEVIHVIRV